MKTVVIQKVVSEALPLLSQHKRRLLVWSKLAGMWKKSNLSPLSELRVMRREWSKKG